MGRWFALWLIASGSAPGATLDPRLGQVEESSGLPTVVWVRRPAPGQASPRELGLTPVAAARRELERHASLYKVLPEDLRRARVASVHDRGTGAVIVSFFAQLEQLPVFRERLHVILDRELRAVALTGALPPWALNASAAPPFRLAPRQALSSALAESFGHQEDWLETAQGARGSLNFVHSGDPGAHARVRPVLFSLPGALEAAYHLELEPPGAAATSYVVAASDGRILFRHALTDEAFAYRVFADPASLIPFDGPQGNGPTPHPTGTPDGYQAPWVAPQLISVSSGPLSTLDPWLPDGATQSTGNNLECYADLAAPDGFGAGDVRGAVSAPGVFDRTYDPTRAPRASADQTQAVLTQLFYTLNFLHDWYYDAGFDEASGNAQASNLGRGGLEGDSLKAEAQDYFGRTNASMTTPSDGARPRLQVFLFDAIYRRRLTVTAPASLAREVPVGVADFGPSSFLTSGPLVLADDGTSPSADGCETPFLNAAALVGKVALLDRGTCPFATKVANAQAAGASAVVVGNNTSGAAPAMPGTDPAITIPSLSVSQADAAALKSGLPSGLQVTLEREPAIDRDGALDNAVISHEWGHYLSDRLIGDSNGLDNKMGRGLGEGWSDFQALLMMTREEDSQVASNANFAGTYAMAGYAHSGGGNNGYYYGLRRLPYSTDFSKNALTFKHLSDDEPLPVGVPTQFGQSGSINSEVHCAGEVWATMLWEGYVSLLRDPRLSFPQAQDRMRRYLVASLKATPVSPTLLEARDALLAVAYASDPADHRLLSAAFARRGAGLRAIAPPRHSLTHTPLVEDFTTGGDLAFVKAELSDALSACDDDGILDPQEIGRLTLTVRNVGVGALSATTGQVSSTTPGVTFPRGPTLRFPATQPYEIATASTELVLEGAADITRIELAVSLEDPGLAIPGPVPGAAVFRANADEVPASSATDDVESSATLWSTGRDPSLPSLEQWRREEQSAFDHHWLGPGPGKRGDLWLVSPPLQVSSSVPLRLSFRHRYEFEARGSPLNLYDAGVIELSDDDGATWVDIGEGTVPSYDGTVLATSSNVLKGRRGFGGRSPGHPAMTNASLDLGSTYAGKTIRVRFRIASDDAVALSGWELDELAFTGIEGTPFGTVVPDPGGCVERRPVARLAPAAEVMPGARVSLDGSESFDPEGQPLSFRWSQLAGPEVKLSGADGPRPSFSAPRPAEPVSLVFELVVNDGQLDSLPAQVELAVQQELNVSGGCGCSSILSPMAGLALLAVRRRRRH